jgi:hypothetical protein
MASWRDLPPHTAGPPDGSYRRALARHVRHVRPVGDDGVLLLFHDRLGRVISSTSTSSQVTRMEPQPEPQPTAPIRQIEAENCPALAPVLILSRECPPVIVYTLMSWVLSLDQSSSWGGCCV